MSEDVWIDSHVSQLPLVSRFLRCAFIADQRQSWEQPSVVTELRLVELLEQRAKPSMSSITDQEAVVGVAGF